MSTQQKIHPLVKILAALMSLTIMMLGSIYISNGYVPESWNKHGYVAPMYGHDAKFFGAMMITLGVMPLLFFCKNTKQATILGSLWGISFLVALFAGLYIH